MSFPKYSEVRRFLAENESGKSEKMQSNLKIQKKIDLREIKGNEDSQCISLLNRINQTSGNKKSEIEKILAKSEVLHPDFEKLHAVPTYNLSARRNRKIRQIERQKTKGENWFNLPATEVTEEVKKDLEILKMRSVLDPKHFYKRNDLKTIPKYFQIGTVMDSPLDYYNNRLTKKERKKTLVDELLANSEFTKYNKRKYAEIISERQKTHYKEYRKAKMLKKKKC